MINYAYPFNRDSRIAAYLFICNNLTERTRFLLLAVLFLLFTPQLFAITKVSTGSGGNWNTAATWNPVGVPANGDDVVIASGDIVIVNTNTNNIASLTVNGTLTIGNNNTDRVVTVTGNILVTGVFNTAGNGGNAFMVAGSVTNDAVFDMKIGTAEADVTFNGSANQLVSGTGSVTDFNFITINNTGATGSNVVEILPSNFTTVAGFLTLTKGILKMSGNYTLTNTFFNTAAPTINSDEGIWLNNINVTVTGQNGDTRLYGLLRISAGTYNVGVAADWWLYYYSGAIINIDGGALNVSGAFVGSSSTSTITYTQTNGIVTVNTTGNNYSVASFDIRATASIFTMSGGTIILQLPAATNTDYVNLSANNTISGGTLQTGNTATPAASLFWINSTAPLYNIVVNNTNNPTTELRTNTTVLNDLTINGGTLSVAPTNSDIYLGHDWINNGSFTQGTATVTLNGITTQQIGGSNSTTFNNITIDKLSAGVTLNKTTGINGVGTFTAGIVTSSLANLLVFNDNATTAGANNGTTPSYVHGPVRKIGNDAFTFPVGKTGAGYRLCGISAPSGSTDAFTAEFMRGSATTLGTISAAGLHIVSNCEYWNIDRTAGSSNVNVTLSWSAMSNCNTAVYVNSLASLVIAHFNGSNWNSYGSSSRTGNVSSGTVTWNAVSSFSPFTLGSNNPAANPLQVKFSSIAAYALAENNKIEWVNETEENLISYEVERSTDAIVFGKLTTIVPRSNHATSEKYTIDDITVYNRSTWYRIKATEQNGRIIYSPVVQVNRDEKHDLSLVVYPNPVTGNQFTLQLNSQHKALYTVKIINLAGQQVFTTNWQHAGGNAGRTIELPLTISPGLYLITINSNGTVINSKMIIQ